MRAVELAAQISSNIAARQDATVPQRQAAAATVQAPQTATAAAGPAGWQFGESGSEIPEAARAVHAAGTEPSVDLPPASGPQQGVDPNERGA